MPWKNLKGESVVAEVSDIYILLSTEYELEYDPVKAEKKLQEEKKSKLEQYEAMKAMSEAKDQGEEKPGFVGALVEKIIDNLQVKVQR